MKTLFAVICLSLLAVLGIQAQQPIIVTSQVPGVYSSTFNGGTNVIKGGTTNTYYTLQTNSYPTYTNTNALPSITWAVSEHPTVGLSLYWFTPNNTTTNGSNVFKLVKSYDNGNTFETTPSILLTNILPTALQQVALGTGNTNVSVYDIACSNATHIGLVEIDGVGTANLTNYCSNVVISVNMNSPLGYSYPAPR